MMSNDIKHLEVLGLQSFTDLNAVNKQRLKRNKKYRADDDMLQKIETAYSHFLAVGDKMENAQEIVPGLLVGPVMIARNVQKLVERGITHVLSVAEEFPPVDFREQGVKSNHVGIRDEEDIFHTLSVTSIGACMTYIHESIQQGGRVLVHCQFGRTRSAIIAVIYVSLTRDIPIADAYRHVQTVRDVYIPDIVLATLDAQRDLFTLG
jgi:protein-tyrosine phosphatase